MLSMFKRKPKPVAEDVTIAEADAPTEIIEADFVEPVEEPEPVRRVKQQNIKASEECCALFDALARAQGMTKADLFEDMVVERSETLQRRGVKVETAAG
jgi:hypothetical protein